jgi:hypothetical protein
LNVTSLDAGTAYFYGRDKRLSRATLVAMMQTADLRERADRAGTEWVYPSGGG